MDQLIDSPVSLALGWTLLHFFWQGCLIALLAKIALSVLHVRSSNIRYVVSCAAFATMALAPCFTFRCVYERSPQPSELAHSTGIVETYSKGATETRVDVGPEKVDSDKTESRAFNPSFAETSKSADAANAVVHRARQLAVVGSRLRPILPWLVVAWFGGVCLLSLRLALSWRMLRRLKTTGLQKVSKYQQRLFAELRAALGVRQVVDIARSSLVQVPTLVGWAQPIVLLPMSAMSGLDESQLRALLAHELAHVRRADFLVNLLQTTIETLLFYHPAVWWLSARIRQERENGCDDLAVETCRDGRSYVEALLRMEELRSVAAQLAMSASGGSLAERASRLLHTDGRHPSSGIHSPAGAAFFSLLLLALFTVSTTSILPSAKSNAAPVEPTDTEESEWKDGEVMPEQVINEVPENILTHTINIVGRAKDAEGKPIAGATIYVASHEEFHKLLKTTTTDKNGKYAFRELELPIEKADGASRLESGRFEVYGTAKDYAFAWRSQKSYYRGLGGNTIMEDDSPDGPGHFEGDAQIRLDLTFKRPVPLGGTIVDDDGKPIPDAKVHLFNCWYAPNKKFSDLDMGQYDMSSLYSSDYCPPEVSTVRTNEKGEFRFANAPPECRYRISVKPPGFAGRMMYATTELDSEAYTKDTRRTFFSKKSTLEANGMRLVFASPREVRIRLVGLADPKHGDGAFVNPHNKSASSRGISGDDGIASMKIPPGEYTVSILPPINTPYWRTSDAKITVTEEKNQTFELEMTPAAVVDVQVVDESGDPVEGAEGFDLWVEKVFGGRPQRDIHYFRNYERATNTAHVHRVRTDVNGVMRANFLPGKYRIGVGHEALPDGWRVVDRKGKEVDLKIGEPTKVTFRVRPPDNGDF